MQNFLEKRISSISIAIPNSISLLISQDSLIFNFKCRKVAFKIYDKYFKVISFIENKSLLLISINKTSNKDCSYLKQLQGRIFCLSEGIQYLYTKRLSLVGIGFRCWLTRKNNDLMLILKVGFSKDIVVKIPKNILIFVLKNTEILLRGIDKHFVNSFAFFIKSQKPPEPYKLKGIQVQNSKIFRAKKLTKH